jgi:hypothetical protein
MNMKNLLNKYLSPMTFEAPNDNGGGTGDEAAAAQAAAEAAATAEAAAAAELAAAEAAAAEAAKNKGDETEAQKLLREVMDKKTKLKEATDKAATLEAELKKFEGIDLEEVKALLANKRAGELAAEEAKGNFDRAKQMLIDEAKRDKEALEAQVAELLARNASASKTIDELTVGRAFSDSTYIGEDLVLTKSKARQLYGTHFEQLDGVTVGYDKPAGAANRTLLIGADGNALAFDEAMKRIIEADPDKEQLLRAKGNPGSASVSTKVPVVDKKDEGKGLFGVQRILAGLNSGQK